MRLTNTLHLFKTLVSASLLARFTVLFTPKKDKENTQLMYSENEKGNFTPHEKPFNKVDIFGDNISNQHKQTHAKWQVLRLAKKHGLTITHANLICTLQGFGGNA